MSGTKSQTSVKRLFLSSEPKMREEDPKEVLEATESYYKPMGKQREGRRESGEGFQRSKISWRLNPAQLL